MPPTDATKNADVILALGFSFDDRATSAWLYGYTLSIPPSRLIQIDIDSGRDRTELSGGISDPGRCEGVARADD